MEDTFLVIMVGVCSKIIYPIGVYSSELFKNSRKKRILLSVFLIFFGLAADAMLFIAGSDDFLHILVNVIQMTVTSVLVILCACIAKKQFASILSVNISIPAMFAVLLMCHQYRTDKIHLYYISWFMVIIIYSMFLPIILRISGIVKSRRELEEARYQALMYQKRKEIEKNNNVAYRNFVNESLKHLLLMKENFENTDKRSEAFEEAGKFVNRNTDTRYCFNSVINGVVADISKDCELSGIDFKVSDDIRKPIHVDELALCSIVSNLLGNAYNHCELCVRNGYEQVYIHFSVKQRGVYTLFNVVNSYHPDMNRKRAHRNERQHGWGQKILEDIAKKYDGRFETEITDTEYKAEIIVEGRAAC